MAGKHVIRVALVTNNPRWEGTEAQIASLAAAFRGVPEFAFHGVVFRPGALVHALEELGVPVRVVPVVWQLDVTAVWRLARHLRDWRIDVLHTHGYKANVIGALAARLAGVPAVVRTEHGLPEPHGGLRWAKMAFYLWLDRVVGRCLTHAVIAVAEDVAQAARRRFPRGCVFRVLNGMSVELPPRPGKEEARRTLGLPAAGPAVGIVGRLAPVKDHATFLEAGRRVAGEEPGVQFVIAGNGPLQAALQALAEDLGLGDRVHFRYLPEGAQPVLDALDALVFSSRHEGIPYALLEGLRAGVPVVATAVGGLAETLTHGEDALLVPPGDPEALATAVLRVLREPPLARSLVQRGQQTLRTRFALDVMRDQTAAVYRSALTAAPGRRRPVVRSCGCSVVPGA